MRTQGKGRVFYTAWGHDQRTWGNPGFQNLSSAASAGRAAQDPARRRRPTSTTPQMTEAAKDVKPFEYVDGEDAVLPARRGGARRRADHEDAEAARRRRSR